MANETWLDWSDKLKMFIDLLSSEGKKQLLEILLKENKENEKNYWEPIPELVWDRDKILKYICENYVKKFESTEFWEKWTWISVKLPAVWWFEWFEFNCFKTEEYFGYGGYTGYSCNSVSYSMEEICGLYDKINEFLCVYWVWYTDIEKNSAPWVRCKGYPSLLWKILYEILDESYFWLRDNMPPCGTCLCQIGGSRDNYQVNFVSDIKSNPHRCLFKM